MNFEGNLVRKSMPVFDDREADISKEGGKLNLQNLALEKMGEKEISSQEKNECFKILFEQNPDLAMELAKKEDVFPLTTLSKSGFFYFQKESSGKIVGEILGALNSGKIKVDEFKIYAPEILDWAKKNLAFEIIQNTGGTGRKAESRKNVDKLVELTGQKDEELDFLLGKNKNTGQDDHEKRESQLETAERIFRREMEKVQDLPEGKNIFYQNAKAVFSTGGEAGLKTFLEKHSERAQEIPPHLLLDLHYMRYAGFRDLKLPEERESKKKTPREIGIDAINMIKDALEKGETTHSVKAHGKTRMHRLAKALSSMLKAPGTLTEGLAYSELKRDFEKSLADRYDIKVGWDEEDGIKPEYKMDGCDKDKKIREKLKDKDIDVSKFKRVEDSFNFDGKIYLQIVDNNGDRLLYKEKEPVVGRNGEIIKVVNWTIEHHNIKEINGKLFFWRDNGDKIIPMTEDGPFMDIEIDAIWDDELFFESDKKTYLKLRNINEKWVIGNEDGLIRDSYGDDEFEAVFNIEKTNEGIVFVGINRNKKCVLMTEGGQVCDEEFDRIGDPIEIGGRIYFRARIEKELIKSDKGFNYHPWIIANNDGFKSDEFGSVYYLKNINNRAVYRAEKKDGKSVIMVENIPLNGCEYGVGEPVDIDGKIVFATYEEGKNAIMTEDGLFVCDNGDSNFFSVDTPFDYNGEIAFPACKEKDKWTIMTKNGPISNEFYESIEYSSFVEGKIVFWGKKNDKWLLVVDGSPIKSKKNGNIIEFDQSYQRYLKGGKIFFEKYGIGVITENGILGEEHGDDFKPTYEQRVVNNQVVCEAKNKNGKYNILTEKGVIGEEYDTIFEIFEKNGQVYVLGKMGNKIVRRHIPELNQELEENPEGEKELMEIELNFQEKEILEMLNILKLGQNRPRWKADMSEEEKERYGEFYDRFRELSKKFFQEESKKIPFNSLLQEAVAGFSQKNKLYAQKNSADPNELLNDFKDAWLKNFIRPEERRDFERNISSFRDNLSRENNLFDAQDDPEMAFSGQMESTMMGGDPKMEGVEILENVDGYSGFLVGSNFSGGLNGKFNKNDLNFLPEKRFRETEKFAFKVNPIPRKINQLNLPMPAESRLKGISAQNESGEVELENRGNRENILIDLDGNFQEIRYEIERNKLKCPIDAEMKWHELKKVYARLPESVTADFSQHLFSLPVEMKEEMEKIKNLPIIEQVATLQKMAQDNFHYDMDYGSWRKSAGKELKHRMNKSQLQAIKHKKLFAGVCAEANLVMCQVLRQAGILSGIAEGFMADGKNIKNTQAHACTFALLPNERGEMEKYYIDGTPGGAVEGHLPSISEMQKSWEKSQASNEKEIIEKTSKDLEKMVEYLEGELKLLNGDIEALLNGELKRVIAGGAEKLVDINQSLGIVRFSGLNLENLTKMEADVKGFFEKEISNPRTRSLAKKEIEKNGKQAGEYVLDELKKTVDFLENRFGLDKKQAREWFKNFNKNNLSGIISIEEQALLNLAIDYINKK